MSEQLQGQGGFGLSFTEARPAGVPKPIGAVTEARVEICETTRLRPPELPEATGDFRPLHADRRVGNW